MARPVTIKKIKETHECVCGRNEVEDYEMRIRYKDLRGMKRRIYKNTGETFFLMQTKSLECHCND